MLNNKTPLNISALLINCALLCLLCSCKPSSVETATFTGDEKAVDRANQMFDAVGGMDAWCELKSLYIKAQHTEPQMTIPYQSEIWRGIDQFDLVIEQQNDSFHVKAVVNDRGGTIRYYDQRDTFRILSDEQLEEWKFDHNHNVYVLLHDLGCNPENYEVKIFENTKLAFYKDSTLVVRFGLDDKMRPYLFDKPNLDGSVSGSIFSHWGTDGGLVHSAGGHPLDSNFIYRTEIWQPSNKTLAELFGDSLYMIE